MKSLDRLFCSAECVLSSCHKANTSRLFDVTTALFFLPFFPVTAFGLIKDNSSPHYFLASLKCLCSLFRREERTQPSFAQKPFWLRDAAVSGVVSGDFSIPSRRYLLRQEVEITMIPSK